MALSQGAPPFLVNTFWLSQGLGDVPLACRAGRDDRCPVIQRNPTQYSYFLYQHTASFTIANG